MIRVPPIVLSAVALLGLVVGIAGIAMNWAEVAPVAFFVFVFCTILATMQAWLATVPPYTPPVTMTAQDAAIEHAPTHDGGARVYEVPDADVNTPRATDDE